MGELGGEGKVRLFIVVVIRGGTDCIGEKGELKGYRGRREGIRVVGQRGNRGEVMGMYTSYN